MIAHNCDSEVTSYQNSYENITNLASFSMSTPDCIEMENGLCQFSHNLLSDVSISHL
jgi:hypothetical protein